MTSGGRLYWGLALFAMGYSLWYYATNVLVDAYMGQSDTPMNPAPLAVLIGIGDPSGAERSSPTAPRRGAGVTSGSRWGEVAGADLFDSTVNSPGPWKTGLVPVVPHNTGGF